MIEQSPWTAYKSYDDEFKVGDQEYKEIRFYSHFRLPSLTDESIKSRLQKEKGWEFHSTENREWDEACCMTVILRRKNDRA